MCYGDPKSIDKKAAWSDSSRCICGKYLPLSKQLLEVPISGRATHSCVQIEFTCRQCAKRFVRTYDLTQAGKRGRTGLYRCAMKLKECGETIDTYNSIETDFGRMSSNYKQYDCKSWAKNFYELIR
ncbi:hypothetical protein DdX_12884 [Ditylenchus destructor]|uniref:Uncharacterized protein n=1 Tax=Ditylenchus destructor TaxID=166010 RepID=A0AAD4MWA1_9BILA|nr:hypothetical protein DdX_12884 [Ditylenchus destructor]